MLWLSLVLIAIGLIVLIWIIGRHFSQLRMLNIEAAPGEREKRVKSSILRERVSRLGAKKIQILRKVLAPVRGGFKKLGQGLTKKVTALELSYEQAKRLALGTRGRRTAQLLGLLREAEEFVLQERYPEAEKKYIAVISLDPKNIDAYEGLGNLYRKMRRYPEAREALNFILKIRKVDASVETSLGEVALAEGQFEEALPHFRRAVARRPKNPKYLDFLIETAINVKDRKAAEHGLRLIRESNPENNKISEWEEKIKML